MNKWINRNLFSMALFSALSYSMLLLLTFDAFCLDTVTPEQPLITIAGQKFFRNEFTMLLFALTAAAGAAFARIINRKAARLLSVMVTSLFIFMGFLAVFQVDVMQSLVPEMRISHVTMSVSRALSIVAGASGIPVGYLLSVSANHADFRSLLPFVCMAGLSALAARSEQLYVPLYLIAAAVFALLGILCSFAERKVKDEFVYEKSTQRLACRFLRKAVTLSAGFLFALTAACVPNYYTQHLRGGENGILAAISLSFLLALLFVGFKKTGSIKWACFLSTTVLSVLLIFFENRLLVMAAAVVFLSITLAILLKAKGDLAISAIGGVIGLLTGYYLRHFAGTEIFCSNNRIYNITQSNLFIVITAVFVLLFTFYSMYTHLSKKKRTDQTACDNKSRGHR